MPLNPLPIFSTGSTKVVELFLETFLILNATDTFLPSIYNVVSFLSQTIVIFDHLSVSRAVP